MPNDLSLGRMLEALDAYVDAKVAAKLEEERGGHNGISYAMDLRAAKHELFAQFKSFLESEGVYGDRS